MNAWNIYIVESDRQDTGSRTALGFHFVPTAITVVTGSVNDVCFGALDDPRPKKPLITLFFHHEETTLPNPLLSRLDRWQGSRSGIRKLDQAVVSGSDGLESALQTAVAVHS